MSGGPVLAEDGRIVALFSALSPVFTDHPTETSRRFDRPSPDYYWALTTVTSVAPVARALESVTGRTPQVGVPPGTPDRRRDLEAERAYRSGLRALGGYARGEARVAFEQALRIDPNFDAAAAALARMDLQESRRDRGSAALQTFEAILVRHPRDRTAINGAFQAAIMVGACARAPVLYSQAVGRVSDEPASVVSEREAIAREMLNTCRAP